MPLMRYKIGDMAIVGDKILCSCGRTLPLIGSIKGRISDQFRTRDGKQVHGERFTELFYDKRDVKQFQVIQESYDRVRVLIVLNPVCYGDISALRLRLGKRINSILGDSVDISFRFVDRIAVSNSGKRRYTISKVKGESHATSAIR